MPQSGPKPAVNPVVWRPSKQRQRGTNLARFIELANASANGIIDDYAKLYQWSIEQPADFWALIWDFCDVRATAGYQQVLSNATAMPGARWFEGAELNFADNLLGRGRDGPALVFYSERGDRTQLSWGTLESQVANLAAALTDLGVKTGDRVAGFLPNRPETVVAMLATASIGASWSSCSPDFGINGVLDRFAQIQPKVLFAVDGYFYNGRTIDTLDKARSIASGLPSLACVVLVRYSAEDSELTGIDNVRHFHELVTGDASFEPRPLGFDHPLYILYSSGTTGAPKCIVHGAGGTLLQHLKELALHTDVSAGDVVFYFTTCGWMMWNWLISSLGRGATVVLFDGSPFYPDPGVLWRIAEAEQINIFGTSAKYLDALDKSGYCPQKEVDLASLRSVLSTGSPLLPSSYDFVYGQVKNDLQLSSISGGTDLISCFALGNPLLPVRRGEIQCRGLGMKVEIFSDEGASLVGEKGELVCTSAFPSMPLGFWNDPDGERYRAAYFQRFPNVWCHGDYAELTPSGGLVIHGRSDAVLNPGGVRIGTAEIYRVVDRLEAVLESIAVGQDWEGDVRVVLFVRLQPGHVLDDELRSTIKQSIRQAASPRHVPARILEVPDIPRTISGKIVEVAVREVLHGRAVHNTHALANPEALEYFRNRSELAE
jgi:acetoacetyl-CoA synthetase